MKKHSLVSMSFAIALACAGLPDAAHAGGKPEFPLLAHEDFSKGAGRWDPTDPKAWKLAKIDGAPVFVQFQNSKYSPKYRSPLNIALLKGEVVADFDLVAKVKSTGKENAHRDVCLFFGHQSPTKFYYVHLAKKADDHANQIFIVNEAARVKISTKTSAGTPWDDRWHEIKITRRVASGRIEIYFDDMKTPAMTAEDRTFAWGRVGIGSFDDSAEWADVKLRGKRHAK